MGLLKPIWMTKNLKKRDKAIAAVQRLEDAIQLENAAINAPMEAVAQAACSRIMDQATLVQLTAPRGGIADGAVVYCSNCGGRVC